MKTRRQRKFQEAEASRIRAEYQALLPENADEIIREADRLLSECQRALDEAVAKNVR